MNTRRDGGLCLAVLIPHRDSRRLLRQWSGELFAAGLHGAWSFPWAAPLGLISRFLTRDELNALAHALREQSLADGRAGKMQADAATALPFPATGISAANANAYDAGRSRWAYADLAFFGPALDLRLPEPLFAGSAATALVRGFPRTALASAIVGNSANSPAGDMPALIPPGLPPPPAISFRAAAVANMIYRPLPGGAVPSFEWQIRELHWLPSVKDKKRSE